VSDVFGTAKIRDINSGISLVRIRSEETAATTASCQDLCACVLYSGTWKPRELGELGTPTKTKTKTKPKPRPRKEPRLPKTGTWAKVCVLR